jgi:predicted ribosome quality control (RQC) complex YloA/Tae2 family protein
MASKMQFFDGVALAAVVAELNALGEARIDKVGQPSAHELYLQLRAGGRNHRLFVSVREQWARLHLTRRSPGNLPVPTGFTMQLRKHLEGSRLLRVEQDGLERVARLVVAGRDELGDPFERVLVVELIGKYANLFLVDAKDDQVMGCLRPITDAMCQVRQVGPGLPYDPPPVDDRKVPFEHATDADFAAVVGGEGKLVDRMVGRLAGLSKAVAGQLVAAIGLPVDVAIDDLEGIDPVVDVLRRARTSLAARRFHPRLEPGPGWDYVMWWLGAGEPPAGEGPSAVLDAYYGGREDRARLEERRRKLRVEVEGLLRKQRERLAGWEDTLEKAEGADRHRELGDLLTAHMYLLAPGMDAVEVDDYFAEEGGRVTIPLDPQLTPSENVQRFFRRYQKARNSQRAVLELLEAGRVEEAYLAQVATAVEQAIEARDLAEIANELAALAGRPPEGGPPRRGQPAEPPPAPLRLASSDGLPILVGKNNRQNEHVTFKEAHAGDWWLHTQNIPGSHVVIRTDHDVPERTLHEAATLAAWFSQGRESSRVPVVYTRKRFVRKPRGAKPGMVIYEQEKTLFVTPDPAVVEALLAGTPAAVPAG